MLFVTGWNLGEGEPALGSDANGGAKALSALPARQRIPAEVDYAGKLPGHYGFSFRVGKKLDLWIAALRGIRELAPHRWGGT